MKTFKKSETYGQEGEWQICKEDRQIIANKLYEDVDAYANDETIDDMIVVLGKLGYVKIE